MFSPVHKRPIELLSSLKQKRNDSPSNLSNMGMSFYSVKNPQLAPITTGLSDEIYF